MDAMASTTIQIDKSTREKLAKLKTSDRETYDEVLNRLMSLIPEGDEEGEYSDSFRMGLLLAKCEIKEGKVVDHAEAKRRLGLE